MPNPDETRGIGSASLAAFAMVTILFFTFESLGNNNIALFIGIPFIAFLIAFLFHVFKRWTTCSEIDLLKVAKGAFVTFGTSFVSVCIASVPSCRIPIASLFGSLVKNNSTTKDSCCSKPVTLEDIESQRPIVKMVAYCFYLTFGMLYGMTYGNTIATEC